MVEKQAHMRRGKGRKPRVLLALSSISVACCWTRSLAASSSHSASFWRISTISEFWVTSSNCLVKSWRGSQINTTNLTHTVTHMVPDVYEAPKSPLNPAHYISGQRLTVEMDLFLTFMDYRPYLQLPLCFTDLFSKFWLTVELSDLLHSHNIAFGFSSCCFQCTMKWNVPTLCWKSRESREWGKKQYKTATNSRQQRN